jgi:hypothetical protein
MSSLEIRTGLRRLEFAGGPARDREGEGGEQRVLVEFVRAAPLAAGTTVRVPLGRRDGVLRELTGLPQLLETRPSSQGSIEYHYRLHGPVAISHTG